MGKNRVYQFFNLARNYEHARKPSDSRGLSIWTVEVKNYLSEQALCACPIDFVGLDERDLKRKERLKGVIVIVERVEIGDDLVVS